MPRWSTEAGVVESQLHVGCETVTSWFDSFGAKQSFIQRQGIDHLGKATVGKFNIEVITPAFVSADCGSGSVSGVWMAVADRVHMGL
jgi:hypothetical protein